jgi:hypothetical protein
VTAAKRRAQARKAEKENEKKGRTTRGAERGRRAAEGEDPFGDADEEGGVDCVQEPKKRKMRVSKIYKLTRM